MEPHQFGLTREGYRLLNCRINIFYLGIYLGFDHNTITHTRQLEGKKWKAVCLGLLITLTLLTLPSVAEIEQPDT